MITRVLLAGFLALPFTSTAADSLTCMTGPIQLLIGQGYWQVTSCSDDRSVVFATVASNPAMPFVFVVRRTDAGRLINGEGAGSKLASFAAFEEIKAMSDEKLDALVAATKHVKPR